MTVIALKNFFDKKEKVNRRKKDIFEVSEERAKELVNLGLVKIKASKEEEEEVYDRKE